MLLQKNSQKQRKNFFRSNIEGEKGKKSELGHLSLDAIMLERERTIWFPLFNFPLPTFLSFAYVHKAGKGERIEEIKKIFSPHHR